MARIPQKFIDDLLDRVDIVDVVDRRVKLRKTGKNFSACCPFHDEKTPSFSVNPEKQFYYCFGCGAGGNAIGFLMDYERLEFPEAVENLAQTAGLEVPREETRPGEKPQQHDSNRPLFDQLEQAARYYEHQLRKHPEAARAVKYLKSRGLTGEIAKSFRVGFAPPGWDGLMSALGKSDEQNALLMTGGMLVKNDKGRTYDRFRDRIMFPILDARGRVIAFGGRVLGDDKPKYLNSPETPVFHKSKELYGLYQARKSNRSLTRIVVVEGYMDVIALAQHGISYAVATLGTATSETHLERLFRHVSEVVFCFDGDEAGRKAAFRGLEAALPVMQDGRQARFLFLPDGEDPDTLVRAKGAAHLEHLFDTATPLETFLFDHLAENLDPNTMEGKARFSKLAAPFLARLPDGVFKTLMYQSLADRTGIEVDSLKRLQAPPPPPDGGYQGATARSPATPGSPAGRQGQSQNPASMMRAGGDHPAYDASGHGSSGPGSSGYSASGYSMSGDSSSGYEPSGYGASDYEPGYNSGYGASNSAHGPDDYAGYPPADDSGAYTDFSAGIYGGDDGPGDNPDGPPFEGHGFDNSLIASQHNPVHRLLGLLVLNPSLARDVDADTLPDGARLDIALLRSFIDRVQNQSELSTAAVLGFWYGTAEGDLLTELAGREPLEDSEGQAALFHALIGQLTRERELASLRARQNTLKAANYADLSSDEKRELMDLTRQIRTLAGRD